MRKGQKTKLAQAFRKEQTNAERLLWSKLRGKKEGLPRIRRQHPIGPYIADFAVISQKLIIEVDGDSHYTDAGKISDQVRKKYLENNGWTIMRFDNNHIFNHLNEIADEIFKIIISNKK